MIVYTGTPGADVAARVAGRHAVVVTDGNVARVSAAWGVLPGAPRIVIPAGEEHKTLQTATAVWRDMLSHGMTRHSVVVCLGGGVVTDLGGFCAATFMRGVPCINVPTTLLAMVDAATGGKTGIDMEGLKNLIGVFRAPEATVISTLPLATLPRTELLSGYAEMLKHALLDDDAHLAEMLALDPADVTLPQLQRSVAVKERYVAADPLERGMRRALNLGHTVGHAIEALMLQRGTPLTHGAAVAWGMVTALVLSRLHADLRPDILYAVARRIRTLYTFPSVTCHDYPALLSLMAHDKKNVSAGTPAFTLLAAPGHPVCGRSYPSEEVQAALDITRDLLESS